METLHRPSGLRVTLPPGIKLTEPFPPEKGLKPSQVDENEVLISALAEQEMTLIDNPELEPTIEAALPVGRGPGKLKEPKPSMTKYELDLGPDEGAILLLEQDGMYSWQYPSRITDIPGRRLRGAAKKAEATRRATFYIPLTPTILPQRKTKGGGPIEKFFWGRVRTFVLKFVASFVVDKAMKFLERKVTRGFVRIGSADIEDWQLIGELSGTSLPPDKPARILLLVHGTFSSTTSGFGSLAGTTEGRKFLGEALSTYDAVLGFNHATLSEDPSTNAEELLASLLGYDWKQPPHIDVIAHSRGGLVFRSLVEQLLPSSGWQAHFDRAIFVACTNGGTQLASVENWKTLADLYTNIAVGACRIAGLIPQAKVASLILGEIIKGLGALVEFCATNALMDNAVPGLAAMQPGKGFINEINDFQPGQPTPEKSRYYAVVSNFEPRLPGENSEPKEFPPRLLSWLGDIAMDQLMGKPNDLVVDVPSMTQIDPQIGKFIKETLDFGTNSQVYHTNYFNQPKVIDKLTQWLQLGGSGLIPPL